MASFCNLIATIDTEDAQRAGRLLGIIFGIAVAIVSICRSALVYEEPGTNRKAAKALILVGFAMLLAQSVAAYRFTFGLNLPRYVAIAFITIDLALIGPGAVLGVIGWLESAVAPELFRRGKGLAVAAVSVGALHIIYMVMGFNWAVKNQIPFLPSDRQPVAGKVMERDRFDFEVPGGPWREYDTSKLAPGATMGFARTAPSIDFSAWVSSDSSGCSPQSAADQIVARLQPTMIDFQVVDDSSDDICGMHGIRLCCRGAQSAAKPEQYVVIWVSEWTGQRFMLITAGSANDLDDINLAADDMLAHFHPRTGGAFTPHWHGNSTAQRNSPGMNSQASAF
jgi:hypothetical protein